ncbi:LysR substrate-binding domain-containing protein [Candidatus Protofrankia californiensis]|uniref:LysR substrate-binding domain-containing protein n=1 Tax=Candidatus Protofrankia californiensis TaxID=1839754 RepID=UPI0013E9D351|nr:LysR substrate-binding domain-containing protein [Candidatus Protofrankia californiensis]
MREPDLTTGRILLREPKLLALSGRHRLAGREAICLEDVADDTFADVVASVPDYWRDAHLPRQTPLGKALARGPAVTTLNEILLVAAAGQAISTVDIQVARRHARRDIFYARLLDTPPFEMGFVWRTTAEAALVRSFIRVAHDLPRHH